MKHMVGGFTFLSRYLSVDFYKLSVAADSALFITNHQSINVNTLV